ncbi:diacylglycerol kinase family lipid kinase [Streptococcus pseudoporcinus]|uniref:Lipid kinase n=2 Tax=Streptococcus pseudoporcinus TaxID=361101 RepID=G5K6P1_9STRE|nr:diacylglycerol kinase family lipid kinase [Streptococcus pseudoporcinus]EFR44232.1 putative lipid kinase [Streptococcus pseudoporcinus SPIN 20026]EHI65799.1 putative lipid kinase [Streptococcus pseudoporcinus LQ 940-04]VEF94590.1 lipid kinase, YegS/Rv2252/BmrU family [Streptococcus pseudoporcinus]VTS20443.1 lipid kinase, YegS/Rv2252/BmrU family [Streptococcus pseudoporcinus]
MTKLKRARLIYNPTSGQEIMKKNVADVLDILESYGYETSAFQTSAEPKSAQKEARRVAETGVDLIIAAGGDGTINEVVNGIAPLKKRPKMAIIPTGTTNDFARALKIPRGNPIKAAKLIGKNQTIKMDIGKVREKEYFINIAAAGSLTELTYSVPSQLKTMFGYLAYLAKGVELLPRVKNVPVKITHDGGIFEGEVSMIFAAITNSVGGFEMIAPDAKLDDGMFTLILVKTANLFEIVHLLRLVLDGGKHVNDRRIEYIKTSKIFIEPRSDSRMMINLDGEYGGDAPIVIENLKNHITFFANTDLISDDAYDINDGEPEIEEIAQKFAHEVEDLEEKNRRITN